MSDQAGPNPFPEGTRKGVVVVLFGGRGDCDLRRCPLGSAEWFPDHDQAVAYCATVPATFDPHILLVSTDVATGG